MSEPVNAGRDLDTLVAEHVFGMTVKHLRPDWYHGGQSEVVCFYAPNYPDLIAYSWDANACNAMMCRNGRDPNDGTAPPLPFYSVELEPAWDVVEQMRADNETWFRLEARPAGEPPEFAGLEWMAVFTRQRRPVYASAPSAPEAICRAALKVIALPPRQPAGEE